MSALPIFTMLVAIVVVPPLLNALITNKVWDMVAFVAKWPFMIVIMSLCFAYLYRYAPAIKDPGRKAVLPGAVLATAGWFVISLGFSDRQCLVLGMGVSIGVDTGWR